MYQNTARNRKSKSENTYVIWLYLHLCEQFKHCILIYFESPRTELGLSDDEASASTCWAILPALTGAAVHWKGQRAMTQGCVTGAEGCSGMHEALSLSPYTTNTHVNKHNDTTSTCTATAGILGSTSTFHERIRALKTAGSEVGARKIQTESQGFLCQNRKEALKERWEHVQRKLFPKAKSGTLWVIKK